MNLFKTLPVLLLAIAAVQGAIQCKSGTGGSTYNKHCPSYATQCVTITSSNSAGSVTGYSCREKRSQKPNGCTTETSTRTGMANQVTKCYCTGNLCNGSGGSFPNDASTRSVNFILAFSGVMIALIKVAA